MVSKKIIVLAALLSVISTTVWAGNLGPKEIIEKEQSFSGWKNIKFNIDLLRAGFIYCHLIKQDNVLKVDQMVKMKADKVYLPNDHYMDVSNCDVTGKVTKIENVKEVRYHVLAFDLACKSNSDQQNFEIYGYVNGSDNFPGLTNRDLYSGDTGFIYVMVFSKEVYSRNLSGSR